MTLFQISLFFTIIEICVMQKQSHVSVQINPVGPSVTKFTAECLVDTILTNFKNRTLIILTNTFNMSAPVAGIEDIIMKRLNEVSMWSLIVINNSNDIAEKVDYNTKFHSEDGMLENFIPIYEANYYVIIGENKAKIYALLDKLLNMQTWNPRAYFIILCYRVFSNSNFQKTYAEMILKHLWSVNVLYAVIAMPNSKNVRNIVMYNWNPYEPPTFCGYQYEPIATRAYVENECFEGKLESNHDIFKEKLPADMRNCRIKVLALLMRPFINDEQEENAGIEQVLMDTVVEKLNINVMYQIVNDTRGDRIDNVWNGTIGLLNSGEGDVIIGGIYPDNDIHEDFDASISYLGDSYTWVVPRAERSPRWLSLIIIFQADIWLSVLSVYVLCVCSWKAIGHFSPESRKHKTFIHCALNSWCMIWGGSAYMRPFSNTLRVFFVFFALYCLILITAYQTKLINVLTQPSFQYQMQTVEQLVNSSLEWGGLEIMKDIFQNSTEPLYQIISKDYKTVNNLTDSLMRVVRDKNFALLANRMSLVEVTTRSEDFIDELGKPLYYAFKQNVFSIPLEFITKRGYPFLYKFNSIIQMLKASGCMEKFNEDFKYFNDKKRARLYTDSPHVHIYEHMVLSLEHLQGGFLVIAFGYIIAIFVFACEVMFDSAMFLRLKYAMSGNVSKENKNH